MTRWRTRRRASTPSISALPSTSTLPSISALPIPLTPLMDIGTTTDADPEQIPCESIKFAWSDFVKQHRSCVDSSECVYAGGSMNYCNCAIAIGDLGGDPIHRHAVPSTQPYLDRFRACRAAGHPFHCGYDHVPRRISAAQRGFASRTGRKLHRHRCRSRRVGCEPQSRSAAVTAAAQPGTGRGLIWRREPGSSDRAPWHVTCSPSRSMANVARFYFARLSGVSLFWLISACSGAPSDAPAGLPIDGEIPGRAGRAGPGHEGATPGVVVGAGGSGGMAPPLGPGSGGSGVGGGGGGAGTGSAGTGSAGVSGAAGSAGASGAAGSAGVGGTVGGPGVPPAADRERSPRAFGTTTGTSSAFSATATSFTLRSRLGCSDFRSRSTKPRTRAAGSFVTTCSTLRW